MQEVTDFSALKNKSEQILHQQSVVLVNHNNLNNFDLNYAFPNHYHHQSLTGIGNESPNQNPSHHHHLLVQRSSSLPYHQDNTHQAYFHYNRHLCTMCDKEFPTPARLNRHLKTHLTEDEKPYKCDMCEKGFSAKWNLDRHVKEAHEGLKRDRPSRKDDPDKPKRPEEFHKCPVCEKVFSHRTSLTRHVRSHQDDKPYECEICNKSFVQASDLGRHSRVHTGEKPFKCDLCDRAFTQSANLSRHLKYHETLKAKKIVYGRDMNLLKDAVDYKKLHEIEKGIGRSSDDEDASSSAASHSADNLKLENDDDDDDDDSDEDDDPLA